MTGPNVTLLLDTNVLVYAHDRSEPLKQRRAVEVLDALATTRTGAVSTQVLSEFVSVATRKTANPLTIDDAGAQVARFLEIWTVFDVTAAVILEAVRGVKKHQLSFWDAQIWAVASLHRVPVILTEDFAGQVLEGVRVVNPFDPSFSVRDWVPSA